MVKIIEIDNGFILEMIEDESFRTFNECNVRKFVGTWGSVLSELSAWNEKVKEFKEGVDEKEKIPKKPACIKATP